MVVLLPLLPLLLLLLVGPHCWVDLGHGRGGKPGHERRASLTERKGGGGARGLSCWQREDEGLRRLLKEQQKPRHGQRPGGGASIPPVL